MTIFRKTEEECSGNKIVCPKAICYNFSMNFVFIFTVSVILCCSVTAHALEPSSTIVCRSLNGKWEFSGLLAAPHPFGPVSECDMPALSPMSDESRWKAIPVPRDWWSLPEYGRYRAGRFDTNSVYFRGFYRKSLTVENPADGRRRFLRFEAVGAEAELFVNGRFVAQHIGDFVPFEAEVTDFLVAGANLVALRVRADFAPLTPSPNRPRDTRPYGSRWERFAIKGGLWHDVSLIETPPIRLVDVRVDSAEDLKSVRIRLVADNDDVGFSGIVVASWVTNGVGDVVARRKVSISSGRTELSFNVPANGRPPWSPESPNLHTLVLTLSDEEGRVRTTHQERVGLRTMRIRNGRFELNGAPIYLIGDSLHSHKYGGRGRDSRADIRRDLLAYKANGANMLRTAHMPAIPELYEVADEVGMMIYDEWAMCFCSDLDEPVFERNNLTALAAFIRRDYNHPSVVCWSLGNENNHRRPEVGRQLDLQYDLVKSLDGQGRPICSFSGVADVWLYGTAPRKTDFLDTHRYHGIDTRSWTEWFPAMNGFYAQMAETYGQGGRLTMPLIMWECVGAGWGVVSDDTIHPGDVARYVEWSRRPCSWGNSEGQPFAGATGLLPILDSARGRPYLQGYLVTRLAELFRQDSRLAGFAPWFADPEVPGWMRWTQQTYPLLRNDATDTGRLMFRHWFAGETRRLECVVVNDTARMRTGLRAEISFAHDATERLIASIDLGRAAPFSEAVRPVALTLPTEMTGDCEIRLRVIGADGCESRNEYAVRVWSKSEAMRPVDAKGKVVLMTADEELSTAARSLGVPVRILRPSEALPEDGTLIVPPRVRIGRDAELASFVRRGGTLLALEPSGLTPPGFPFLRMRDAPNHLIEPVAVTHPIFDGLTAADFDTWAESANGHVVNRMLTPIDDGVLAARPRYIKVDAGMAMAEYRFGAGRYLVSTVATKGLWNVNPSATRYLRNLLVYVSGVASASGAPVLDPPNFRPVPTALSGDPLVVHRADAPPIRVEFPAAVTNAPHKILFLGRARARLTENRYRYLTLTFSGNSEGLVDITIPSLDHGNRLTCTLPLACSTGDVTTVRLDLMRDFRFAKPGAFPLSMARGEIILYNGYEKDQGFPRPPAAFSLHEMKFE